MKVKSTEQLVDIYYYYIDQVDVTYIHKHKIFSEKIIMFH